MGVEWEQTDQASIAAQAQVAANGEAIARFEPVESDDMWQINRAVVACTGGGTPNAVLHIVSGGGSPGTSTQRSGTNSGLFDEADYAGDGLVLMGDEQLLAVWEGADPGAVAVCTITYRRYTRA